jgi:DNA ligase D-like protein (predicted polymerase)
VANAIELEVGGRRVRVTNPDKVYFAERGITKGDVVRYFLSVGEGILAAVRDRPTMLERWPGGMAGSAIFQRRIATGVPDWVQTAADGVYPTELAVVAWAASLGTLRFHPSPVRRPELACPDELRIDLDPQPGTGFREAVAVAAELRGLLAEHGLAGFPKTSGGRGVHVAVPILPRWTYADVARTQEALARELVRRMPRQATMVRRKRDRGERVYVDHGQFLVAAAYSIRPTARATVSAPVTWDELETAEPEDFDVTTMPARFAALGDLQAGLADDARSIEPLLEV